MRTIPNTSRTRTLTGYYGAPRIRTAGASRGTSLRGLADATIISADYVTAAPPIATATAVVETYMAAKGTPAWASIYRGLLDADERTAVVEVSGVLYAVEIVATNQAVTTPAGMTKVVMGEFSALVRSLRLVESAGPTPPPTTPPTSPDGCPCRTETTVVPRQVTINVRQTRVICDTPPPTTTVPPCDEVTADVRRQLNAQGVQGLRGLRGYDFEPSANRATMKYDTLRPSRNAATTPGATPGATPSTADDSTTDITDALPWVAAGAAALFLFAIIK